MRLLPALTLPALVLIALTTLPARAETALTAEEFDAYSRGKTLTYSLGGEVFGTEEYLADRRVRWAFSGDSCTEGRWYEDAGLICFVYDEEPTPQCWKFYRDAGGLRARFMDDPEGTELSEVAQSDKPLACPGPDVGV